MRSIGHFKITAASRRTVRSPDGASLVQATRCFNVLEGFGGDKNEAGQRVIAEWKVRGLPWSQ
jgi:hypothetical protein